MVYPSGVQAGQAGQSFRTRGLNIIQLVRTPDGWRVSALAWDDARASFSPPESLPPDPASD